MLRSALIAALLLTCASAASAQTYASSTPYPRGDPLNGMSHQQQLKVCEDSADFVESTAKSRDMKIPMSEWVGHSEDPKNGGAPASTEVLRLIESVYQSTDSPAVLKNRMLTTCYNSIK
jgi:hypothetical protein